MPITWTTLAAANTTKDGTSGTVANLLTAPSQVTVEDIVFRAKGTNVATVARVWINNGQDRTTATNNTLYTEITLPATTLDEAAAFTGQTITMDLIIPEAYRIFVSLGTGVAAGYAITTVYS